MFEASKIEDPDPDGNPRVARVHRLGAARRTAPSARTTCSSGSSTTRAAPAPTCRSSPTRPTSTRSRRARSTDYPGDRAIETPPRGVHPLERDGDGRAGQPAELGIRRPHRELRLGGDAVRSRVSTTSGGRPARPASGRHGVHPGSLLTGHLCARLSSKGRLTEEQLQHFREEVGGGGLSSYPHPWLMPDFWQFPTVSMGLGPMMAIYQARFMRYLEHRGIVPVERPQGLVLPRRRRDGRARVAGRDHHAGAREARQPGVRDQLQPAAARRSGARQRQDHPGTRGRVPRRRLERASR